jgi:hypothetical protein
MQALCDLASFLRWGATKVRISASFHATCARNRDPFDSDCDADLTRTDQGATPRVDQ